MKREIAVLLEWYHHLPRPLIAPDDAWALWTVIIAGTFAAIWLEQTYRWAGRLSGAVLAIAMAMALSNLGIMPTEAPTYKFIDQWLVPLAIPLLLLRANVVRIARETGWMFVAFHVSALGTMLGAVLAVWLLRPWVEHANQVAGIMTASYTGGAVNFFAVKESFDTSANLTNPLLVADNVIMVGIFAVLLLAAGSRFVLRHYSHPHIRDAGDGDAANLAAQHWRRKEISLRDIAAALAVAFAVVIVSRRIAGLFEQTLAPLMIRDVLGNAFVWITFLSMAAATLFHRAIERIHGSEEIGGYLLYVFLFAIGLPADLAAVVRNVPVLFAFCLVMAVTNLVVTLAVGKLLRLDLEDLLVSVSATLGGPPTAAALAIAKGWSRLVLPGLLMGIWGYVIGTFLGVTLGEALARLLP
ncbi:MAG: DUF819 family protein [Pirellulales bacterium]|nr:DUF819 family protein [Pirellulales bacterium]